MANNRISPIHFVNIITQTYAWEKVDEAFSVMISLWKKYGRRLASKTISGIEDHDECMYVLYHYMQRIAWEVTVWMLKKYRRWFREKYDISYVNITTLWDKDVQDSIDHAYIQSIQNTLPRATLTNKHIEKDTVWLKVIYNTAIYNRSIDSDIDALIEHIL